MADQFYGVDRGANVEGVTTGTSTTSKDVELRIDLSAGLRDAEIEIMVKNILRFRRENPGPTLVT